MDQSPPPDQNATQPDSGPVPTALPVGKTWWLLSIAVVVLPWISQPPLAWWPLAAVSVTPLLLAASVDQVSRKQYAVLYAASMLYWALTLQGLRHANPLIYPCWLALAAYLAVYPVGFVIVLRRSLRRGIPMIFAAPLAWVGMECVRNYLLTGISAAMLGHTLADVPSMIQIADLGGTYAVSLVIVAVNVGLFSAANALRKTHEPNNAETTPSNRSHFHSPLLGGIIAVLLCASTFAYGRYRISQPTTPSDTTIALIGRSERVEYEQDPERELELFDAYAKESIRTFESNQQTIDAVVWPESMLTGTIPWRCGEGGGTEARDAGFSIDEELAMIAEHQRRFLFRAAALQSLLASSNGANQTIPHVLGGCGVVEYDETTKGYSGIVHINPAGKLDNWYGKTHLVMFGEYIPVIKHLPFIANLVPRNLGLTPGDGARRFQVGDLTLCPNICIETAVERVPINHLRQLRGSSPEQGLPDAIVTVTNDGWFDDSSVVQHHKRCAQLAAVACRRPILSAANNGPTTWIDSCGRVVAELPQGGQGHVIASPQIDGRTSLVMRIGDWPARIAAFLFLFTLVKRRKTN